MGGIVNTFWTLSKLRFSARLIEDTVQRCRYFNNLGNQTMSKMIFVNLPVMDLDASITFYKSIGFENNPQFTDDTAACMVWSEAINVMLLTHAKWRTFTNRPIPPATSSEVMLALSCDSREAVDAMNEALQQMAEQQTSTPLRSLALCITVTLRIPTVTSGRRCGWTWQLCLRAVQRVKERGSQPYKARSNLWRSTVAWHAASWKLRYWKRAVESLHIDYWNQFSSCNQSVCSFDLWARKY